MENALLSVSGLRYQWTHGRDVKKEGPVLDNISFDILRGQMTYLMGPNGSGKSTLLKAIAGILPQGRGALSGSIRFLGSEFLSMPTYRKAQNIVYVASDLTAEFPLTAEEVVSLGRACQNQGMLSRLIKGDEKSIRQAMELCLCWDLRHRRLDTLSGGERQLVALASALAQNAKIICLDETLSKMDLNHQVAMCRVLRSMVLHDGLSVIWVSHDMNLTLEWIDQVLVLLKGKLLFQGTRDQVITSEILNKIYPGGDWIVSKNPATGRPKVYLSGLGE
jgi:iron complex transport system ATP-binding protein